MARSIRAISSAITIMVLLIATAISIVFVPGQASALLSHPPIYISGNADFTNASGVTWGSGTLSDPFIIEGWEINASSARGLEIRGTNAHFVIRNISIHSGSSNYHGMYFVSVTNATVRDCNSSDNLYGMQLLNCDNVSILENQFVNNMGGGIDLDTCTNMVLEGNLIIGTGINAGIRAFSTSHSTICNNTCRNTSCGISVDSNNNIIRNNTLLMNGDGLSVAGNFDTIYDNDCSFNSNNGIMISGSNNSVFNNTCNSNSNYAGIILLTSSSDNIVMNNSCVDNFEGIDMGSSFSNRIENNNCSENVWHGIGIYFSEENKIANNTCGRNGIDGIHMQFSNGNLITRNILWNSRSYGVEVDSSSTSNQIWMNVFLCNRGTGAEYNALKRQASDNVSGNFWDHFGIGNYWLDWRFPDADFDGVVDIQYSLNGFVNVKDHYPIAINPILDMNAPSTTMTVSGTLGDNGWYTSAVSLSLSAIDPHGHKNKTYYTINGASAWTEYTNPFQLITNQVHRIRYYSNDSYGHYEIEHYANIGIDSTAPTLAFVDLPWDPTNEQWIYSTRDITINWSAMDSLSGFHEAKYRLDDDELKNCTSNSIFLSNVSIGNRTLELWGWDSAGNLRIIELNFHVYVTLIIQIYSPQSGKSVVAGRELQVSGQVRYQEGTVWKGGNVTVDVRTLFGANVTPPRIVVTMNNGIFSANIHIPDDLQTGDYVLVITAGRESMQITINVIGADSSTSILIVVVIAAVGIGAIGAGVILFFARKKVPGQPPSIGPPELHE